jgi:hypothetical protein
LHPRQLDPFLATFPLLILLPCLTLPGPAGRYIFMHNGVVAGFMQIRRRLLAELGDAAYNAVQSFHSDSAVRWVLVGAGVVCVGVGEFWVAQLMEG